MQRAVLPTDWSSKFLRLSFVLSLFSFPLFQSLKQEYNQGRVIIQVGLKGQSFIGVGPLTVQYSNCSCSSLVFYTRLFWPLNKKCFQIEIILHLKSDAMHVKWAVNKDVLNSIESFQHSIHNSLLKLLLYKEKHSIYC